MASPTWTDLRDDELTTDHIRGALACIDNDLWVATACLDRVLDDVELQRELLQLGISRTDNAIQRAKAALGEKDFGIPEADAENSKTAKSLDAYFANHSEDAQLCSIRAVLLDRSARLECYVQIADSMEDIELEDTASVAESWEDDPWADEFDTGSIRTAKSRRSKSQLPVPVPLSLFLTQHPSLLYMTLVSNMQFNATKALLEHIPELFIYRFAILDAIPLFADPSSYRELLPVVDPATEKEQIGIVVPTRDDWCQQPEVLDSLKNVVSWFGQESAERESQPSIPIHEQPLTGADVSSWYRNRVNEILSKTGMVDIALSIVQHGVSLGVSSLDEVGEDLTLISRLVYDAHSRKEDDGVTIPLDEWRTLTPFQVVQRYLANSTPKTVVSDITRLVMPYLFVLESRAERAGRPDSQLAKSLLHEYILSAPLELLVPIFDASKPTLLASQRIISDDEDIARLALSCLYGNTNADSWTQMSRIFECLPLWNIDDADNEDEVETTMSSLASYLAPSTTRPLGTPSELLGFFTPLHASSLSKALDILDVHLESGEILAKWGTPVTLQWLLQSAHNENLQRACATKLVRTCNSELDSEDDWLSLLEDMLKLSRSDSDTPTKSAFGTLSKEDIRKILFNGLLSSGNFPMAKSLVRPRAGDVLLGNEDVEQLCLDSSREFYDNAANGNYNFGDMKQAYDCLSVSPPTPAIEREKEFIEATSRISSYNIMSRPGAPLLPIDIRLTKDKLSLISRVLSGNETAYKHVEVILDLVRKLGFKGDTLAEVKTLAMITDTALQAEDFDVAYQTSDRMVNTVLQFKASSPLGAESQDVLDAVEVCWISCFQLGRHPEADDTERKMYLLSRALELCPPDKITDILTAWRKVEEEMIERRQAVLGDRKTPGDVSRKRQTTRGRTATLASKLQNLHINSPSLPSAPDAAAIASHALNKVAASLPFSLSGRDRSGSRSREGSRRTGSPDVQAQARHALQRGIGWLIGADESEL